MTDPPVNVKILGERRESCTIDVARSKFVDFLSHGTNLNHCRVNIHGSARGIVFHGATLQDCEIVAKRRFTGYDWGDVVLRRCRFVGVFDNCRFGPRYTVNRDGPHGVIEDCDFSSAKLGWCEFYNCDVSGITIPTWPTFVIDAPPANSEEWMSIPFPASYASIEQTMIAGLSPEIDQTGLVAVTQNADAIAKRHSITTEEIRALISGHRFIRSREESK
jgi:hypothetical protein